MRRIVFLALLALAGLPAASASAQTADNKAMAQRIGSMLKESGELRDYRVGVRFQDGVAWLNGTVTDAQQADAAARITRQVPGVSHVVNQLRYEGSPNGPTQNASAIRNAFSNVNTDAPERGAGVMQALANTNQPPIQPQALPRNTIRPAMPIQQASPRINQNMARSRPAGRNNMPRPMGPANAGPPIRQVSSQVYQAGGVCPPGAPGMVGAGVDGGVGGGAVPVGFVHHGMARGPSYDNAQMPGYAWPSYASYPNYAALTYPQQYSPTAWPYIGPFYPYPQVPLAWRKVALEWDDGWWFLDFSAHNSSH